MQLKDNRIALVVMIVICVSSTGLGDPPNADQQPPNIVVIIADDLGYGETGMMGNSEIPTPHIDRLAKDGTRCLTGYVTSSYCSPSRAGFFTGRYQSRFGYDINPTGKRNLLPQAGLPESETTFVQRLAKANYKTGLIGKWHLGAVKEKHPLRRGFGSFYGFLHEGHFYVPGPPYEGVLTMIRDRSLPEGERVRKENLIRGNYTPISEPPYDDDNPLLRGEQEIVEAKYLTDAITDEAVAFVNENAKHPFCLVVAYNAVHSPMQATAEDLDSLRRITDDQRRIFAGMLVALDRGVGRIRESIDEHQLGRRTLVVFFSDNGGPTRELTSSNLPLRGGKGTLYEGGVRVPMIWSMPNRIPAGHDEKRTVLSLDVAATALELAGLEPDPKADGVSVLNWINNRLAKSPHQSVYWRMNGGKIAYRAGNWKIVRPNQKASIELYHLASDPAETDNVAARHPDKLKQLVNEWSARNAQMTDPIKLE